jgi:glyoxylase-like metal-dependent hydrolase (beta-lactamase superfamily II)
MLTDRRRFLAGALGAAGLAALPFRAGRAANPPALASREIAPGVRFVTGAGANVVALAGPDGQVLVDGGLAAHAKALLAHLDSAHKPVRTLFNTHWHWNHTGSNEVLGRAGVPIIAHENTRLWMQRPISIPWEGRDYPPVPTKALPTKTFYTSGAMQFGPHDIRYGYLGQAHTDGDLYVHLPNANVLVTGGVLNTARWPVMDYVTGGWIGGLAEASRSLLKLCDDKTIIAQGSGEVATKAQLLAQAEMLEKLKEDIWQLMRKGMSDKDIIAAKPTAAYDAALGDPTQFIQSAYKGLWGHVREQRGVV